MFSIIIPTFNNLEYLKLCLGSLEKNSKFKVRIKPITVKIISGPMKETLNIKVKCSMLFLPRYSARNFVPAVPK